MKSIFTFLFLVFLFCSVLQSCNLVNPSEPTPSYIQVNSMRAVSNYSTQGTSASKISDVWIYIDGTYLGTFELPARVPVLASGLHEVVFSAGILDNGIASTRIVYPFYKGYETTANLKSGEVTIFDTIPVNYYPGIQYTWYEDFENAGISLDTLPSSLGGFNIDQQQPYEGAKCLHIGLTTSQNIVEMSTNDSYQVTPGSEAYLEMNYKCDQTFTMGIISEFGGNSVTSGVIDINPNPEWNKIYISLKRPIGEHSTASSYKIWFRVILANGATQGNVYLDNLKLLHN